MAHLNVEIKARCPEPNAVRRFLETNHGDFRGLDRQTDTYFNVVTGRLKLREGNIENNLIYYERNDQPGAKESNFTLVSVPDSRQLKEVLTKSLGIKAIVRKDREIWYIDNVKFHIDQVEGLGSFVEIEASDLTAPRTRAELRAQCDDYTRQLGIGFEQVVSISYSDMLLGQGLVTGE